MQQLIAELTRPAVLSDRTLRHRAQLQRAHGEYVQQHGREPIGDQVANRTGLTHPQVGELLALERIPQSMDQPVKGAEDELGAFGELLADRSPKTLTNSYSMQASRCREPQPGRRRNVAAV